jgi:hypothetical protein
MNTEIYTILSIKALMISLPVTAQRPTASMAISQSMIITRHVDHRYLPAKQPTMSPRHGAIPYFYTPFCFAYKNFNNSQSAIFHHFDNEASLLTSRYTTELIELGYLE